jgi:hypothetical protein
VGGIRGSDPVRRLRLENGRQPQGIWRCCGWFDDSLEVKIGTKRLANTSLLYCFSPKSDQRRLATAEQVRQPAHK